MTSFNHSISWRLLPLHSLKARLVALFLLLALFTIAVFAVGMQRMLQTGWQEFAKPLAADYVQRLTDSLGTPPDPIEAAALTDRLPISIRIDGPVVRYDSRQERNIQELRGGEGYEVPSRNWGLTQNTRDGHRVTVALAKPPDGDRPRLAGWATLVALLALTMLAYASVRRMLAPLGPIRSGVEAYGLGNFDATIPVHSDDELGALAARINGMANNLKAMLEAKRTLLLAVSHELRTPLTRARVNAELVTEGVARTELLHDLTEMRDLITDLLESERLVMGHAALHFESTDLSLLIREVIDTFFAGIPLGVDLGESITPVDVDPMRIRLLLRNLISNAVRHSRDAPRVPEVFLRHASQGLISIGIRDYGPGVSAGEIERLGQAFYRPDSARTRAKGGVGLGLYLSRLVAEAHGGTLHIRRMEPGLEVTAEWPVHRP